MRRRVQSRHCRTACRKRRRCGSSGSSSVIHALTSLECFDEAIATARAALEDSDAQADERARLQYSIAYALWSKGDNDVALEAAWNAVSLHPANEDAMWLIREIEQRHSRAAMQFRLIVEGQIGRAHV